MSGTFSHAENRGIEMSLNLKTPKLFLQIPIN